MSEQQPEALRLADLIEWTTIQQDLIDAADELRRLHEVNAELLEALIGCLTCESETAEKAAINKAIAAIAKATGEEK